MRINISQKHLMDPLCDTPPYVDEQGLHLESPAKSLSYTREL